MNTLKKLGIFVSLGIMMSLGTAVNAADMTISTPADFVSFVNQVNSGDSFAGSTVTLANDIDMQGVEWVPAGTSQTPFAGTFNGNNKQIINVTANFSADKTYAGIIGYNKGTVKNLTVEAAVPTGEGWDAGVGHWTNAGPNFTGLLVGYNEGNIDTCVTQGFLTVENKKSVSANGGICGYNKGTISNCTNVATVRATNTVQYGEIPILTFADSYTGGIAGVNEGTVTGCKNDYNTEIRATSEYSSAAAGGIVGDNRKGGIISNCNGSGYVYGWIKFSVEMGYAYAGGVVGSNGGTVTGTNANQARVYAVVEASDEQYRFDFADFGGLCGYNYGTIDGCISNTCEIGGGVKNYAQPSYKVYGGGVVGYNKGTVTNVESTATYGDFTHNGVVVSPDYLGGICGYNEGGIIGRAHNKQGVTHTNMPAGRSRYLGGVAGVNDGGYIYLSGSNKMIKGVNSKGYVTGGVAGKNTGVIENCYYGTTSSATGYVVGGVVGENTGDITACYSASTLLTGTNKDGITYNNQGYVKDCYSSVTTAHTEGKVTSSALKKKETYKNWDFDVFWYTNGNALPTIKDELGEFEFFGEGNGTIESPYMITNQAELNRVRYQPDKHYRLMMDINCTGSWAPIGSSKANAFTGTFDGNGHKITNLTINGNSCQYNGLFGYVDGGGVYNLTIENAQINVNDTTGRGVYVGGVAGFGRNNATIENCSFGGTITAAGATVTAGGIVGDFEGTVKGVRSTGALTVNAGGEYVYSFVGGIAGKAEGTVSGSNSDMSVKATENDNSGYPMETTGGIVGLMKGDITDCCFDGTANVTDYKTAYHGGVAGSIVGNIGSSYTDYEMGMNDSLCGAIAGQVMQGGVDGSYYNSGVSYDSFGTGRASMTGSALLTLLRTNATEKKYIWVTASDDQKPEPLNVTVDWIVDTDGFTKCRLTPNTSGAKIYYTTDGTAPSQSSSLYEGPILADLMDKISYIVVSGTKTSEVMGFVSAPHSVYPVEVASIPKNQNGELLSTANLAQSTSVTANLLTEDDTVGARIFLVVMDAKDRIVYATTTTKSLVKGANTVTFDNLQISAGEKIQIYIWDDEMKLVPRSEVISL